MHHPAKDKLHNVSIETHVRFISKDQVFSNSVFSGVHQHDTGFKMQFISFFIVTVMFSP